MNGKVITTSKTNFKQRKQMVNYAALRDLYEKNLLFLFIHSFIHSFLFQSLTAKIQVLM